MRWIRDGYATYHAVADRPLCTQSYDTMSEEAELPIGAHTCSFCVRVLAKRCSDAKAYFDAVFDRLLSDEESQAALNAPISDEDALPIMTAAEFIAQLEPP